MGMFHVSVDVSRIIEANEYLRDQLLDRVTIAVREVAANAATEWQESVMRAKLWTGEKEPYATSIQWRSINATSAEVWTEYKLAEEIEEGRPAKDLKRMLDSSPKVRASKDGRRYLIIPFRHNIKDIHAAGLYEQAHDLRASRVTGRRHRETGVPFESIKHRRQYLVPARRYQWGDRLLGDDVPRNMRGMVRMDTTSGASKRSSAYMTFRTMIEGSPGWIIQPRPGLHILRDVATSTQAKLEFAIGEAIAGVGV